MRVAVTKTLLFQRIPDALIVARWDRRGIPRIVSVYKRPGRPFDVVTCNTFARHDNLLHAARAAKQQLS